MTLGASMRFSKLVNRFDILRADRLIYVRPMCRQLVVRHVANLSHRVFDVLVELE